MKLGVLSLEIVIPGSQSLKEKRVVMNRIRDRVQAKFNVSVAEVDFQEKWQRSVVAIAKVANQRYLVEESLQKIFRLLDQEDQFEIIDYQIEIF